MSSGERDRATDSLLHPGRGHTPSYGLNEDVQESEDSSKGTLVSLRHARERVWTVAIFSLIACIGSFLIGMFLGYSTNTLAELGNIDSMYGIEAHSTLASIFGVSCLMFPCALVKCRQLRQVQIMFILPYSPSSLPFFLSPLLFCFLSCLPSLSLVPSPLSSFPQSFGALGAIFGGPVAWPMSDFLGRKPALMLGGIPALIGWLSFSYANLLPTREGFIALLIVGRVLTGFASGWIVFCVSVRRVRMGDQQLYRLCTDCRMNVAQNMRCRFSVAVRLMRGWSLCLSLYNVLPMTLLYMCIHICLSACLCLVSVSGLSVLCLSVSHVCLSLCVCVSLCVSVCLSVSLHLSVSLSLTSHAVLSIGVHC